MVTIIFETHATTADNESKVASGHYDTTLSALGEQQARELGERYKGQHFDAVFCSDLQRSYKTAELAFGNAFPIIKDARLRECDYGDLTRHSKSEVDALKSEHITKPFPSGESYRQADARIGAFLSDLFYDYDGKKVMIIGHRATQYGLEHWLNGVPIADAVAASWQWQPGWEYHLYEVD